VGLHPGAPHDVLIDPTNNLTVTGPTVPVIIQSLQIGGGAGNATLALQLAGRLSASMIEIKSNGALVGNGTVDASITNAGHLSPGSSTGLITIDGDYDQKSTGQLLMEIASPTSFDRLEIRGNAQLAGSVQLSFLDGFTPQIDQSFDIIDWNSVFGAFSQIQLPALPADRQWNLSQFGTAGILSVSLTGDFNGDLIVDSADYVVWRKLYAIDPAKYGAWRANFGRSASSGAITTSIPEPSAACLAWFVLTSAFTALRVRPK
jgi:hypothetical protein